MNIFDENTLQLVRELVQKVTKFEDNSKELCLAYEHALHKLQTADSMFFVTQKDIDGKVARFADKFLLHGCLKRAEDLQRLYNKLVVNTSSKDELRNSLNVMMLLLSCSMKPKSYLLATSDYMNQEMLKEEEIDWGTYLMEGVERWSPPPDSDSDEFSDEDSALSNSPPGNTAGVYPELFDLFPEVTSLKIPTVKVFNSRECREKLFSSIQNTWFHGEKVRMLPQSSQLLANSALEWEDFLSKVTMGLLDVQTVIISEHKIIREIIWQFWNRSNGVAFKFSYDTLVPNPDITIASCRPEALQHLLKVFLPYINELHDFRQFETHVLDEVEDMPDTYKNYLSSLRNILQPTMDEIVKIEASIIKQEETMTLIRLYHISQKLFKTLMMLKSIHETMKVDYENCSSLECATSLLTKLNKALQNPESKAAHNIYLCLYLESLYKYMITIHYWLNKAEFVDVCKEFPIVQLGLEKQDCLYEFTVHPLRGDAVHDEFLNIICTRVLQIGRNIHLLHLLGKYHLVTYRREDLHEEFVSKVLKGIANYFAKEFDEPKEPEPETETFETVAYKFPAICMDNCRVPTEMDRLENLVDTSDAFLMKAFDSFFVEQPYRKNTLFPELLYTRILSVSEGFFPVQPLVSDVFPRILEERYSQCGIILKQVIKDDYNYDEHLELLCRIFLFKEDIIFPFYKRLFTKVANNQCCGNDIRLTSHLQDILMDAHPDYYSNIEVFVENSWEDILGKSCKSSRLFGIKYKIKWPIDIIIRDNHVRMYEEMFYFIFQIKWALHGLNHLNFRDIEPKKRIGNTNKTARLLQMRLKVLRFGLINIFSLIQHYILGYVFPKCYMQYEACYEKSVDFDGLMECHDNFITQLYKLSTYLRDYNKESYGFFLLLHLVRELFTMWKNPGDVDSIRLENCQKGYLEVHKRLEDIVMPVNDVFNDNF